MADATDYLLHAALGVLSGGQKAYQRHIDIEDADELARRKMELEKISPEELPPEIVSEYGITQPIRKETIPLMAPSFFINSEGKVEQVSKFRGKVVQGRKSEQTDEEKLKFETEKAKRKAEAVLPFEVQKAQQIGQKKEEIQKASGQPKAESTILKILDKYADNHSLITKIKKNLSGLTYFGQKIPLTKWKGVKGDLDTLKTRLGFDELSEMRLVSPTGGALGQVSEREGEWLQSAKQKIDLNLGVDKLLENLTELENFYNQSEGRIVSSFEEDYKTKLKRKKSDQLLGGESAPEVDKFLEQN